MKWIRTACCDQQFLSGNLIINVYLGSSVGLDRARTADLASSVDLDRTADLGNIVGMDRARTAGLGSIVGLDRARTADLDSIVNLDSAMGVSWGVLVRLGWSKVVKTLYLSTKSRVDLDVMLAL